MDQNVLECKMYSYLARMSHASKAGDKARRKKAAGLAVVTARMQARDAVNALVAAEAEEKAVGRAIVKAKENGISFPLGDQRLEQLEKVSAQKRKELVDTGSVLCMALDMWQSFGATLHDLANLCNRSYGDVLEEIGEDRLGDDFSGLVFVHNLDYKDNRNRGWIDYAVDAPLTHAVKEYWMDLMLHTREGRAASHEALEQCFPEIMEHTMTLVTDADGVQHLIDKDGVEIGTVGEGE